MTHEDSLLPLLVAVAMFLCGIAAVFVFGCGR